MERKVFDSEIKQTGEREFAFVISTASLDRDGDVIEPSGWDLGPFRRNPVVLFAHDHKRPPIAKATHITVEDGKLKATIRFPEPGTYSLADEIRSLVEQKILKATSVGFIPSESEPLPDGGRRFLKQELLEFSIVNVGSNRDALAAAAGAKRRRLLSATSPGEHILWLDDEEIPIESIELDEVTRRQLRLSRAHRARDELDLPMSVGELKRMAREVVRDELRDLTGKMP